MIREWVSVGALCIAAGAFAGPRQALHALFEREFRYDLEQAPEWATMVGVDDYDDRLTDLSPDAIARRKAHAKALVGELEQFDTQDLERSDRLSLLPLGQRKEGQ